jgi:hypothetical protein
MSEKEQKCDVEMVPAEDKAWKLVIKNLSPTCMEALQKILKNLGPAGKRYLLERVQASEEIKRILEEQS